MGATASMPGDRPPGAGGCVTVVRGLLLILLLVVAVPGALFTIQNAGWTAQLSLDLHVLAYQLKAPMPVPHLMWASFGVGILAGMIGLPLAKAAIASGSGGDDFGGSNF